MTIAVVSESAPIPPHSSESVIVRIPTRSVWSMISQEKQSAGSDCRSSSAATGVTDSATNFRTVSRINLCSFVCKNTSLIIVDPALHLKTIKAHNYSRSRPPSTIQLCPQERYTVYQLIVAQLAILKKPIRSGEISMGYRSINREGLLAALLPEDA